MRKVKSSLKGCEKTFELLKDGQYISNKSGEIKIKRIEAVA